MLNEIIARIKKSKYYSVSVDSIPDEAYVEQLIIVLHYMGGINPVERFLTFVPDCGLTGIEIENTLIRFLDHHRIEVNIVVSHMTMRQHMCRKYQEMQVLIKLKMISQILFHVVGIY